MNLFVENERPCMLEKSGALCFFVFYFGWGFAPAHLLHWENNQQAYGLRNEMENPFQAQKRQKLRAKNWPW